MSRRVDHADNQLKPRSRPKVSIDQASVRLAELDLKLGIGEGARSERAMLKTIVESGGTASRKPARRGKRKKKTE